MASKYTGVKQRCRPDCPRSCRRHRWAWWADVGTDPVTGERLQKTGTADTAKKASEARAEAIKAHRTDGDPLVRTTLADCLEAWYERQVKKGRSPSTLRHYREHIDVYINPVSGKVPVDSLRLVHVENVVDSVARIGAAREQAKQQERAEKAAAKAAEQDSRRAERESQGRKTPGPKPAPKAARKPYRTVTWETQRVRVFATLRAALNSAVRRRELARNPCDQVETVPATRVQRVDVPWTLAQLTAFLGEIVGERLAALFALAVMSGMRRGELCGLRWQDVDLDGKVITVRQQHVVIGHEVIVRPAKTEAGRFRRIRLDEGTVTMLRAVQSAQRRARLAIGPAIWTGNDTEGLVFTWEDGRQYHPGYVTSRHTRLLERLGLPHIRLHDLRHLSATLGGATGETLVQVSRRLGHSSVRVTGDLYSHVWDEQDQDAADARARFLRGTGTDS